MSERKVLNKYYPPDFDPSKIPRCKLPKNVRISINCKIPRFQTKLNLIYITETIYSSIDGTVQHEMCNLR